MSQLDELMDSIAVYFRKECMEFPDDNKLACPCCGGSGEHYTDVPIPFQNVSHTCSFCQGFGYVLLYRKTGEKE